MNRGSKQNSEKGPENGTGRGRDRDGGDRQFGRDSAWEKVLIFVWVSLAILLVLNWIDERDRPAHTVLTYSEFLQAIEQGQVREVTLRGQNLRGN